MFPTEVKVAKREVKINGHWACRSISVPHAGLAYCSASWLNFLRFARFNVRYKKGFNLRYYFSIYFMHARACSIKRVRVLISQRPGVTLVWGEQVDECQRLREAALSLIYWHWHSLHNKTKPSWPLMATRKTVNCRQYAFTVEK